MNYPIGTGNFVPFSIDLPSEHGDPDQLLRDDLEEQRLSSMSGTGDSSTIISESVISGLTCPSFFSTVQESSLSAAADSTYLSAAGFKEDDDEDPSETSEEGSDDDMAVIGDPMANLSHAGAQSVHDVAPVQPGRRHSPPPVKMFRKSVEGGFQVLVKFHWQGWAAEDTSSFFNNFFHLHLRSELVCDTPRMPTILEQYMNAGHWQVFLQAATELATRNHRVGTLWLGLGVTAFAIGLAFTLYGLMPLEQEQRFAVWHVPVGVGLALVFAGICLGIWGQANRQGGVLFANDMQALCANASEQVAGVTFQFKSLVDLLAAHDDDDDDDATTPENLVFGLDIIHEEDQTECVSSSNYPPTPPFSDKEEAVAYDLGLHPTSSRTVGSEVVEVVYNRLKQSLLMGETYFASYSSRSNNDTSTSDEHHYHHQDGIGHMKKQQKATDEEQASGSGVQV